MIDIKKEMKNAEMLFIKPKQPDKYAAAERFALTEKMFKEWHYKINETDIGGMPKSLVEEYENACIALCKILSYEKDILNK